MHVSREWNVEADRWSHPSQFKCVNTSVVEAGWLVCRLEPPSELWSFLEEVMRLPLRLDDEGWDAHTWLLLPSPVWLRDIR